jgi:hypothetical protein
VSDAARMYSTTEAARLTGVALRTVDYWAKCGVASAVVPARGTGSARRYDYADLIVLKAMQQLPCDDVAVRKLIAAELRNSDLFQVEIFQMPLSPLLEVFINLARIRESIEATDAVTQEVQRG